MAGVWLSGQFFGLGWLVGWLSGSRCSATWYGSRGWVCALRDLACPPRAGACVSSNNSLLVRRPRVRARPLNYTWLVLRPRAHARGTAFRKDTAPACREAGQAGRGVGTLAAILCLRT